MGKAEVMSNMDQECLKYQKLYNWAHTLITSGVIKNMDKFPSEPSLQKKFGYSRQTVRTALQKLEEEGLVTRVRGSGTYVSYDCSKVNEERPQVGLLLSYYSDYLFPRVYDGIESCLTEKGYAIEVAVTKNRLNDEAIYLEGILKGDVSGLIIDMQGIERYKGFIQCLSDYGVKFDDDYIRWYSTKDMEEKLSKKGLLRMYRRTKDCTAMIVYNDEVANYYMDFLEERGLHVPEDVSLVSFDDAELLDANNGAQLVSAIHPKYQLVQQEKQHILVDMIFMRQCF